MQAYTAPHEGARVAVVGGSVIGLACAWRAARAGFEVRVHEPEHDRAPGADGAVPTTGAGWVAGGMLAPFSEAWPGEEDVFALSVASLRRWPGFLDGLGDTYPARGPRRIRTASVTHLVAVDEADARDLELAMGWAAAQPGTRPDDLGRITRRKLREAEPGLARVARAAYRMPGEGSVDNRVLLDALAAACRDAGVTWVHERVETLDSVDADRVVLAAGCGSAALSATAELPRGLPVRPVKGEVLRLAERPGCEPAPSSVVRAFVRGRPVYLVPRDGGLVVGATQYEHGEDRQVTVAGVRDLLADAELVFPGIGEYELRETIAGLRPMAPDNLPLIGPLPGDPRVLCATGHGRNGIALTPVTADAVAAWLTGDQPPPESAACDPARFVRGGSASSARATAATHPHTTHAPTTEEDPR